MKTADNFITLATLLDMYADLRDLCGIQNAIVFDAFKDNPPRKFRYVQVQAILNAYQLGTVENFQEGAFTSYIPSSGESDTILTYIYNDSIKKWPWVIKEMSQSVSHVHSHHFPALFKRAMLLRLKLEELIKFNNGVVASFGIYNYAYVKSEDLLQSNISSMIHDVNCFLTFLIDPLRKRKRLRIEYLVRNFDYPDIDIKKIDAGYL